MSAPAPRPPVTGTFHPSTTPTAAAADPAELSAWWLALAAAAVSVVAGAAMLAWPEATLKVVAVLFGLWLLIHGLVQIVRAMAGRGRDGGERALLAAVGIFFVVSGVIALRNLLASIALIGTLIGLMWLIGGILELIAAFGGGRGAYPGWHVAMGALSIVAGIVVLVWPNLSLTTLVYLTGVWMIVMGLLQVAMVLVARRAFTAG